LFEAGNSLLYNHGLWKVPKNYRDEIRFFRSVSRDEVFEHFAEYSESRGVSLESADKSSDKRVSAQPSVMYRSIK
jgi:hypothetical protein